MAGEQAGTSEAGEPGRAVGPDGAGRARDGSEERDTRGEPEIERFDPEVHSVSELTALLHQAYASLAARGLRYVATWQGDDVTLKRARAGECYLLRLDGRVVGTVVFRSADRTTGCPWYDRPEVASFGQFAVLPEAQGHGLGSRLLALCEGRARETGAGELACDTAEPAEHLVRFYLRRGYRPVDTVDWPVTNYRSVVLSKSLDGR